METLKKAKGFYLTFADAQQACPAGGMIEPGLRYRVAYPGRKIVLYKGYYVYVPETVEETK